MKTRTSRLLRSGLLTLLLAVCGSAAHADFPELALNGSAEVIGGLENENGGLQTRFRIRLTPDELFQVGSAWLPKKVKVGDGFITGFRFRMDGQFGTGGADGFAFVIQNAGLDALGAFGDGIGYHGIPSSLAVEFDSYFNASRSDPNDNHVSVHTCGVNANSADESASLGAATNLPDLNDGSEHHVIITYFRGRLSVILDDATILSIPDLPLADILDENGEATIGFTGATGALSQSHDIYAWAFRPL
jgi:peptide-N4-(N-acetyl-beta-glucosaminyl)asparagine amidase